MGNGVAWERVEILTLAGVLAVLLAVTFYNNLTTARAVRAAPPRRPEPMGSVPGQAVHPWLCKFARHEGHIVGESVAIEDDRLVMKQAGVFKIVAMQQVAEKDGDLEVSGAVDWAAAEREGAAWYESKRGTADTDVAGVLTRSEDVKAPALEAFEKRHHEE